jgi:hypothetical protein
MNTSDEVLTHCPLCGEPLRDNPNECSRCDWVRGYREQENWLKNYNPRDGAAAVLSIIPGAGHIFKGYVLAGWLLMLVGPLVLFVFGFATIMYFGLLLLPTYWIAVALDAYLRKDLRTPATPAGPLSGL